MITKEFILDVSNLQNKIEKVLIKYVHEKHPNSPGNDFYFDYFEINVAKNLVTIKYDWFGNYSSHNINEETITIEELVELLNKE